MENKITDLVFCGDLFETRTRPPHEVFNEVYWRLRGFADDGIRLYMLSGNHDMADTLGADRKNALDVMREYAVIMTKHKWYVFENGLGIQACPFTEDADQIKQACSLPIPEGVKFPVRVMHTGIEGARPGSTDFLLDEEISPEDVQKTNNMLTFVGHYHTPQELDNNIIYVGSTIPHSFKDEIHPARGFIVADLANSTYERQVVDSPQFITMELDMFKGKNFEQLEGAFQNNVVRVNVSDPLSISEQKQIESFLDKSGALDRLFKFNYSEQLKKENEDRLDIEPDTDRSEMIEKYVKKMIKLPQYDGLDEDFLTDLGRGCINAILKEKP